MIFNTLSDETSDDWEIDFVEIKLNIPKHVLRRMIQYGMHRY